MAKINLPDLRKVRKELHDLAELSNHEISTSAFIQSELERLSPNNIINKIGGHGIVAKFKAKTASKSTYVIRAELDALPYGADGQKHLCGHDGHMTIALGVAQYFASTPLDYADVYVLFQPAEETGEGANRMLNDKRWSLPKNAIFLALHNLPGKPLGTVFCKAGVFSAASVGVVIKLEGITSHAAEPDKGINPAGAVAQMLQQLPALTNHDTKDFQLVTPICVKLGDLNFGMSPADSMLGFTIRTLDNARMLELQKKIEELAISIAKEHHLKIQIEYHEKFDAVENNQNVLIALKEACKNHQIKFQEMELPNLWSEDYGCFLTHHKGLMFGLGAGETAAPLHHPDYTFPDDLISIGVQIFIQTISQHYAKQFPNNDK